MPSIRPIVLALLAGLALALPAAGQEPPAWEALAGENEVVVITRNEDGSSRETTIWLVVVDGQGYIRTGASRWYANIERDPNVVLHAAGTEYPLRARLVTDTALQQRVEARFREKYGFSDRVAGWMRALTGATHIMQLAPRTGA